MNPLTRALALTSAVAVMTPATLIVTTPAASASVLCETVNICGHARNAYTSNRNIAVKCQNGDWWWVKPATDDPCKDVVKVKIPTTGKTWMLVHTERLNGSEWVLMNQGAYVGVSDGQTKRFKTRKP